MNLSVRFRPARLDDTQTISEMFRATVPKWQRLDERGHVQDERYGDLTIYERWLHGGPWMSIETSAIWLNHLLRGHGHCIVGERVKDQRAKEEQRVNDEHTNDVIAYAELFPGNEPEPFGKHLHIGRFIQDISADDNTEAAFMDHLFNLALNDGFDNVTVALSGYDKQRAQFYRQLGMESVERVGRYMIPANSGQGFYKAIPHTNADPAQIDGWQMIVGRIENARQQWETLWPPLWQTMNEIRRRQTHRLHLSASGQMAFVVCQQDLFDPRSAEVFCWSPMPLKPQLVTAIADWAHRENYRRLLFSVPESSVKALGQDVEAHPYQQDIYALNVHHLNDRG